jgi:hypothetical protein
MVAVSPFRFCAPEASRSHAVICSESGAFLEQYAPISRQFCFKSGDLYPPDYGPILIFGTCFSVPGAL